MPESAIGVFEELHGLRVTVHDFRGDLWAHLDESRFFHAVEPCAVVKSQGAQARCNRFDREILLNEVARFPDGLSKICHAGVWEWVFPVFENEALRWLFFAGIRAPNPEISPDLRDSLWKNEAFSWREIAPVSPRDGRLVLEHLRQLAARIALWLREQQSENGAAHAHFVTTPQTQRATQILRFIERNHRRALRLRELAQHLGLSEARTSHLVCEVCGASFQQLLLGARLRSAQGFLRYSDWPIPEVARRSGFKDVRGFTRLFRREIGVCAGQYRRQSRV